MKFFDNKKTEKNIDNVNNEDNETERKVKEYLIENIYLNKKYVYIYIYIYI